MEIPHSTAFCFCFLYNFFYAFVGAAIFAGLRQLFQSKARKAEPEAMGRSLAEILHLQDHGPEASPVTLGLAALSLVGLGAKWTEFHFWGAWGAGHLFLFCAVAFLVMGTNRALRVRGIGLMVLLLVLVVLSQVSVAILALAQAAKPSGS